MRVSRAKFAAALFSLVVSICVLAPFVPPSRAVAAADERLFAQTGFKIRNQKFIDFFDRRGGVRTFGYPTSREFTFLGSRVQFFQRGVMQLRQDGSVGTMNLLDPEIMPYTQMNSATFPGVDTNLTKTAPVPSAPNYSVAILDYVRKASPNAFESLTVNFHLTFLNTVRAADAYPGGSGNPGLLPGYNLELWGVPTSAPAYDPNNRNFVYQRFQRGIMHFDKTTKTTQGLLLADYLKAVITGQNLPADLESQASGGRFYRQYDSTKPAWVARPAQLQNTDMTMAFEREPAIIIDPGHGGAEIGTSFKFADGTVLREKDLTLTISKRVVAILQERNYLATLTRTQDSGANVAKADVTNDKKLNLEDELQARIDLANKAQATVYVAIHFNGINSPAMAGTETYYCGGNPYASQNKRLATLIQTNLVSEMKKAGYDTSNRGVKADERAVGAGNHFYLFNPEVIRPLRAPAALGESLFLTNPTDAAKARDPKIQEAIAQGYAKAIIAYYGGD